MPYEGKTLAAARAKLEQQRAENDAEHQRRIALIRTRIPEIANIDNTMRNQMTQVVKLTLRGGPDLQARLSALKEANLDLQIRKAELLTAAGYPIDYLDDIYTCPLCRDTGLHNGRVCSCLDTLYNRELTRQLGTLLRTGQESFDTFDLNVYSPEYDASFGCIPRESMTAVYKICRKFADVFPAVSSHLLLQGNTGLGKTFLSACIARTVAEKGYSVCYESAADAFEPFEAQKFSRIQEDAQAASTKVQMMLNCDLMILDDLGTEMITTLTTSAFYTLLNTRLLHNRPTIISTNYSNDELQKKYTQQIVSRLLGDFIALPFVGNDLRRQR